MQDRLICLVANERSGGGGGRDYGYDIPPLHLGERDPLLLKSFNEQIRRVIIARNWRLLCDQKQNISEFNERTDYLMGLVTY